MTMDAKNTEKRDSVRATLRAEVEFSVMAAGEYEVVKDNAGFQSPLRHAPVHRSIELPGTEGERGPATDTALDPHLIDFLIQIEDKLDRILKMLAKHYKCDEIPVYVGEGLDISGSGMRLLSEKKVEPGNILDTRFRIFRYPVVLLQVFGKVVWVRSTEKDGGQLYEIALEFLDLDEDYKDWIISYVFQIQREAIRNEKRGVNG